MDKMPSVMNHNFAQVPSVDIPRSSFNRSHGLKTTFDAGNLVPIFLDEALPGDTFNLNMSGFGRLATPIHPILDNIHFETFFFAVPYRLLWDNWAKFCGEQETPGDSTDYSMPKLADASAVAAGSLADYFGLPTGAHTYTQLDCSALPFRAYAKIWNEWFRDENLVNDVTVSTADGPDSTTSKVMKLRGKRHDYFTSCLPWPQKSDAGAVTLPLGSTADVKYDVFTGATTHDDKFVVLGDDGSSNAQINYGLTKGVDTGSVPNSTRANIYTDLSTATAATVNQLREAFQVQKMYEKDARAGTRLTEIIRCHFGVVSPDGRMQRPEYLGGGSSRFGIHEVPQTSSTDATTPQGNLAAFGTVGFSGHGFTKSFTEHCLIIGLANVRGDITYQQGMNRLWSRETRWDHYWPGLAHLGEQAVLSKEIYADGTANDDDVFGYQERYAEYRYKPSQITGKFRSNASGTLESWHLSEDFSSRPTLNSTFIQDVTGTTLDRAIAVPAEPQIILDAYFDFKCARPMPTYSVPGLIDHF